MIESVGIAAPQLQMHEGHSCRDHDLPAIHIFATLFAMPLLERDDPRVA